MQVRSVLLVPTVLIALIISGCAAMRARDTVRSGLLTVDLPQQAFLDVWGIPEYTETVSGSEMTGANWGGGSFEFAKGKALLEVWKYKSRGTDLVFYRKRLTAWKSDKSSNELATPR